MTPAFILSFIKNSMIALVFMVFSVTTLASPCREMHFTRTAEMLHDGSIDARGHEIPADATLCDTGLKSATIEFHFREGINSAGNMIKMKSNLYLIINSASQGWDAKTITYFQFSDNGVFHYTTSRLGSGNRDNVNSGMGRWQ